MTKRILLFLPAFYCIMTLGHAQDMIQSRPGRSEISDAGVVGNNYQVEPHTYTNDFESRRLGAWASYPLWQDNAYDQNFRVNEMVPGDQNISIVQRVTPYSKVDNYAGAQKLLNMYLKPGGKVSLRYYLKTSEQPAYFKVRFAAGRYGSIDVTLPHPGINKWIWVTVGFNDFVRENPILAGKDQIQIFALAFLTKIPDADPAMPFYLGLDDITFKGWRATAFQFAQPAVTKLPEFDPYIPLHHYGTNDLFNLSGRWPLRADKVSIQIVSYADRHKVIYEGTLAKSGDMWTLKPLKLAFPNGLYLAELSAFSGSTQLSGTAVTICIAPRNIAGKHPRLLFDAAKEKSIGQELKEGNYKPVLDDILSKARIQREKFPISSLRYDLDQFPDEDWLPSWNAFGQHIYGTGEALKENALAYAFNGDSVAGDYARDVMNAIAGWPSWVSPWMLKRGRFDEHRMGTWSHSVALAYDLTYNLMTAQERTNIRNAIMKNIVEGAHKTYVYDDDVISNTSNWIGHTVGGSLMNMAAIYGDGPETETMEPYFTGAILKFDAFLNHVTDTKDGAWGEGLGYNSYTFSNLSRSIPSLYNVFNIDLTAPLVGSYNEFIWGGFIRNRMWFGFGDSGDSIMDASNWAFLLSMQKEPRLSWYYHYLKGKETLDDLIFNTRGIAQDSPFDENPDKIFHSIGTTVFKSGWEKNDLAFVMRTGAFYNHQHLDQGSFWFADHSVTFIEDQPIHNSDYYDDPLYQSHFIQPISHSTILINGNEQSQRVGDPLRFAPGFEDHAFIEESLDGAKAAFSRGNIGRLYFGKVKSLSRNVLYLKPGVLLMLDEAVPSGKDARLTLLYHTAALKDITAGEHVSEITKEGYTLNLMHLAPEFVEVKAVETPHYLKTLQKTRPLVREGMLTVSASTEGHPLVMANLLTTTAAGTAPDVTYKAGNGFVSGTASGEPFAFTTKPGSLYQVRHMETDALALTWGEDWTFAAMAKTVRRDGLLLMEADAPVTCEIRAKNIKYSRSTAGQLLMGAAEKPASVLLNGAPVKNFSYDNERKAVILQVPAGEGNIVLK